MQDFLIDIISDHADAIRAVKSSRNGHPDISHITLSEARDAGLLRWRDRWEVTDIGHDAIDLLEEHGEYR